MHIVYFLNWTSLKTQGRFLAFTSFMVVWNKSWNLGSLCTRIEQVFSYVMHLSVFFFYNNLNWLSQSDKGSWKTKESRRCISHPDHEETGWCYELFFTVCLCGCKCKCKFNVKHRECLHDDLSQRLMIKCLTIIQIKMEFGKRVGFWEEGKTGVSREKPLRARKRANNKLNPNLMLGPGVKSGTHWWKVQCSHHCSITG